MDVTVVFGDIELIDNGRRLVVPFHDDARNFALCNYSNQEAAARLRRLAAELDQQETPEKEHHNG